MDAKAHAVPRTTDNNLQQRLHLHRIRNATTLPRDGCDCPASATAVNKQSCNNDVGLVSASPVGDVFPESAGPGGDCGGVRQRRGQRNDGDKPATCDPTVSTIAR